MIYLGSDHGGFDLKEKIKRWMQKEGIVFTDLGNTLYEKEDDYPDFAFAVAKKVAQEDAENIPWKDRPKGILFCRSAAGMVIAANKVAGIRAATAFDLRSAQHTRAHNDANILALSGDWLEDYQVKKIIEIWLATEFSGEERHIRRLKRIKEFEKVSF